MTKEFQLREMEEIFGKGQEMQEHLVKVNDITDYYELGKIIEHQAFGDSSIYEAVHRQSHLRVHVQVFPKDQLWQKPKYSYYLGNYMQICNTCCSPYVLPQYQALHDDNNFYIVKSKSNGDLLSYVNNQDDLRMPEKQAKKIAHQLFLGLKYLQDHKIVYDHIDAHCIVLMTDHNVKNMNIALTRFQNAKIYDTWQNGRSGSKSKSFSNK